MKSSSKPYVGAVLENAKGIRAGDICGIDVYDDDYYLVENDHGDDVKIPRDYVVFLGEDFEVTRSILIISALLHAVEMDFEEDEALELVASLLKESVTKDLMAEATLIGDTVIETVREIEESEIGVEEELWGVVVRDGQYFSMATKLQMIDNNGVKYLMESEDGSRVWMPGNSICLVGDEESVDNEFTIVASVLDHAEENGWSDGYTASVVNRLLDDMDPGIAAEIINQIMGY